MNYVSKVIVYTLYTSTNYTHSWILLVSTDVANWTNIVCQSVKENWKFINVCLVCCHSNQIQSGDLVKGKFCQC